MIGLQADAVDTVSIRLTDSSFLALADLSSAVVDVAGTRLFRHMELLSSPAGQPLHM